MTIESIVAPAAKIELIRRGWDYRDLAQAIGLAHGTVCNVFSGGNQSKRARAAIEWELGVALWSTHSEFKRRQALSGPLGADPAQMTLRQLRAKAHELGLEHRGVCTTRKDFIELFQLHFLRDGRTAQTRRRRQQVPPQPERNHAARR